MGKKGRGRRRGGEEDEGGEKEGLPPLEWRSSYAPAHNSRKCGPILIIFSLSYSWILQKK